MFIVHNLVSCNLFNGRWDMKETERLPEYYMKICYTAILDLYNQYDEELRLQGRSFAVDYAKATVWIYLSYCY